MSTNKGGRVHLKIKLTGSQQKIRFFHYFMGLMDLDWPWAPERRDPNENLFCKDCGGMVYRNPIFTAEQIRIASKQVDENLRLDGHLKVTVKKYIANPNCSTVEELADPEEETTVQATQENSDSPAQPKQDSDGIITIATQEQLDALVEAHSCGAGLIGINLEGAVD